MPLPLRQAWRILGRSLALALVVSSSAPPTRAAGGESLRVVERLERGEPVRLVCFGDSITGVYYHTGGRRAWGDLLLAGLQRTFPQASIQLINAGISGHTTAMGLERIEKDVLQHQPHLVVVMFGMNDVARDTPENFRRGLTAIVDGIRRRGADVILLSPNTVYPDDPRRPPQRVAEFAQVVREVGRSAGVPVADAHRAFAELDVVDHRAWVWRMSDSIHPNFRGHAVFAEAAGRILSPSFPSIDTLPRLPRGLPLVRERLREKAALRVLAMKPYDEAVRRVLARISPGVSLEVEAWEVAHKPLATLELEAKERGWFKFRSAPNAQRPDLVVIAVPENAVAPTAEQTYRSYTWVINWSQSLGRTWPDQQWDTLVVLPSVARADADVVSRTVDELAFAVADGLDLPVIRRGAEDRAAAAELFEQQFSGLLEASP